MMQRQRFRVTIADGGTIVHAETRFAWNAAIRATEQPIREIVWTEGAAFEGGFPEVTRADRSRNTPGDVYRRVWTAETGGRVLVATVTVES